MSAEKFNLEMVLTTFQSSLKGDDDVSTDEYIEGYTEINKFFQLIGTVFGFVSSDVRAKIEILEEFRRAANNEKFASFKQMMDFEKGAGLLSDAAYVSASRTLLRLHRGLEFIFEFLTQLADLSENDKTASCCQKAYNSTLAKHHPWVMRKGAVVAMYTLPTQGDLLKRVCHDVQKSIEVLPEMLKVTKSVYDRTDKLYTSFDLHGLP